ncbi:MAG: sugar ABC transporter permease [Erysipelotrichales bacterium]|nr:sugar ABC transporter permease [Erysipelotrichales bacterium]
MALFKKKATNTNAEVDTFKSPNKLNIEPFLYLLPFIIGILIFTIYPIFNVLRYSFIEGLGHPLGKQLAERCTFILTDASAKGCDLTWGLGNFEYVLKDKYFWSALKNTFQYVLCVVPVSTCLAIIFAVLLNQKIKLRGLFQTVFFLPMVTSSIAVGICWKYLFNYNYGFINYLLNTFGIASVDWLGQASMNIWAVIIYGIWDIMPMTIILLLSGLQNIDEMYYTAAKVDGAKTLRIFFRITVPLLAPTIGLVMILNTISCFKVYSSIFPLFNGSAGITGKNLYTAVFYIYNQFFINSKYGRAAAAAVLLFFIIFAFTMFQKWFQNKVSN